MAINTEAPRVLAEEAKRTRALLVHYLPDYLFDGTKRQPCVEADSRHSFGVYGKTSWQKKPFKRWRRIRRPRLFKGRRSMTVSIYWKRRTFNAVYLRLV
jgi:hypothetical protein